MTKQKTSQVHKRQPTTVGDAYAAFVTSRQALNVTPRTLGYYADKLLPFITHCQQSEIATLGQVTAAHVRAYLVTLQGRGLAAATVHGAARAIGFWVRVPGGSLPSIAPPKDPHMQRVFMFQAEAV